jgi:methyl-accepting chemotaxis protein
LICLREQFAPISILMFQERLSEKWNIANHILENDVEPKVRDIEQLLKDMANTEISQSADVQMVQLGLLQEKLGQLFETLREDGSRAGAVSIIARVLYSVTENVNISLDKFVTLPTKRGETIDNDRRSDQLLDGCLRVEICQGHHVYEGVTRNIGNESLAVELSTVLDCNLPLSLTVFLPHKDFVEYKNQTPLSLSGVLVRDDVNDQVHQYGIKINREESAQMGKLREAFHFFDVHYNG